MGKCCTNVVWCSKPPGLWPQTEIIRQLRGARGCGEGGCEQSTKRCACITQHSTPRTGQGRWTQPKASPGLHPSILLVPPSSWAACGEGGSRRGFISCSISSPGVGDLQDFHDKAQACTKAPAASPLPPCSQPTPEAARPRAARSPRWLGNHTVLGTAPGGRCPPGAAS